MPRLITEVERDPSESIQRAFTKQSVEYDANDEQNVILQLMRAQVYEHLQRYLSPGDHILELNSGTGLDALYLAKRGYRIHVTDISSGMINIINAKIKSFGLEKTWTSELLDFEKLNSLKKNNFTYVLSNMGGLNCSNNLKKVFQFLPSKIQQNAFVTLVVMPPLSPWDWTSIFKFHFDNAFKRVSAKGTIAHIDGEYFRTYYHSLKKVKIALGPKFKLIEVESLGLFIPPPDKIYIPAKYPSLFKYLKVPDKLLRKLYPFNRMGDHLIMTFKFNS